jgi:hypothetical protein
MYPLFRWKKGFFFHYIKIIYAMETAFGICVYHLKFSSFGEGSGYKGFPVLLPLTGVTPYP